MKCEYCNKEHDGSYASGRFCSEHCAMGFSTKDKRLQINKKVSKKLRGKYFKGDKLPRETRYCSYCDTSFVVRSTSTKRACGNKECISKAISDGCRGKNGGYRTKSGLSKFHGGYYNDVWMDSSWEIRCAKLLDKLKIRWIRNSSIQLSYIMDGTSHLYYPDFYLPEQDLYIEIKGYWTPDVKKKMNLVLDQNDINLVVIDDERQLDIESFIFAPVS